MLEKRENFNSSKIQHQNNYLFFSLLLTTYLITILSLPNISRAQDLGIPIIENFAPKDYGGDPQVWGIVQDDFGLMYFATTEGVMEYDGKNWRNIPLGSSSVALSITKAQDNRIYIGSDGDFGVLAPDTSGRLVYRSLAERLPEADRRFTGVRQTLATSSGVYFSTRAKLFFYSPTKDTVTFWQLEGKGLRPRMVYIPDYGLIYNRNNDLYITDGDAPKKLPSTDALEGAGIAKLLPFSEHEFLCASTKGLVVYDLRIKSGENPGRILNTDIDEELKRIKKASHLRNGNFVILTRSEGAYIINRQGKLIEYLHKGTGLQHDYVLSAYESNDAQLWLGLTKGISRVNMRNPVRKWNASYGFDQITFNILQHEDKIYFASMDGLYAIDSDRTGNDRPQKVVKSASTALCNFIPQGAEKPILLTSSRHGLAEVENDKLKYINHNSGASFSVIQSQLRPNLLFQSSGRRLFAITYNNGKWISQDTLSINGTVCYAYENKQGVLYIGTWTGKAFTVKVNRKGEYVFDKKSLKTIEAAHGLPEKGQISPFELYGQNVFATADGLFVYDAIKDTVQPYSGFKTEDESDEKKVIYYISTQIDSAYYFVDGNGVRKFSMDNPQAFTKENRELKIAKDISCYFLYTDKQKRLWCAGNTLLCFDFSKEVYINESHQTLIRSIKTGRDSVQYLGAVQRANLPNEKDTLLRYDVPIVLDYKENSMCVEFVAAQFEKPDHVQYQYYLEGFDEQWSEWDKDNKCKYTNLPEGDYTFFVRSSNIYSDYGTTAMFSFKVLPPWYRTLWAYCFYLFIGFVFVFIVVRIYTLRLKEQNKRLERIVEERTAEIWQKNEELEGQKNEIELKNVELEHQKEEIQAQAEVLEVQNKELEKQKVELEKLSVVASETDNAVVIMNKDGDFVWLNRTFRRIYGYQDNEFIEKFKNIQNFSQDKAISEKVKICIQQCTSVTYESVVATKAGKKIWLQTTLTPILDQANKVKGFVAVDSDISELKLYEAQLLQSKEEVEVQNEEIKYQRDEIRSQHELIAASIRYASTIQKAILPSKNEIQKYLDYFIIYRPKDVVSGDFYWVNPIGDYIYYIVADCTGHGVPGAFMSMIGSQQLNEIIKERGITDPARILEELDTGIRKALRQEKTDNRDGMDIIICQVPTNNNSAKHNNVHFASAKRPVFIYRKKEQQIERIKGTTRSIGGYSTKVKTDFVTHQLNLNKGDTIYLTSDGYADQNNLQRTKYGTKRFVAKLDEVANSTLKEQHKMLEEELDTWQNHVEQRDDITVMGISI